MTLLEAGIIVNTHGIQGEVKIVPWADSPEFLCERDTLYVDGSPIRILSAKPHKKNVIARLDGISSIDDAMKLKNKIVSIDRDKVTLPEGHHFLSDLIGLEVRDVETGEVYGKMTDILTTLAHEVYVVKGKTEFMIPGVEEFIKGIHIDEGYMQVRLIEGMMD